MKVWLWKYDYDILCILAHVYSEDHEILGQSMTTINDVLTAGSIMWKVNDPAKRSGITCSSQAS